MAVQTQYNERMDAARAGMLASMGGHKSLSKDVETAGVGFGKAVERGSVDGTCVLAAGGAVLGITARRVASDANFPDTYKVRESAQVVISGSVWVEVSVAVVQGDPVHVVAGEFAKTGGVAIANAVYDTTAAADGLAVVLLR